MSLNLKKNQKRYQNKNKMKKITLKSPNFQVKKYIKKNKIQRNKLDKLERKLI